MKKIIVLSILVFIAGMILFAQSSYSIEKKTLHLIVLSKESNAEFDVVYDGERSTVEVDSGWTYISYKVSDPYSFECYTYGDNVPMRIDLGRDGEYYTMLFVCKPEESVGE